MRAAIFFLVCCWSAALSAQTPAFIHYGVRDGLPGNIVYCAAQDADGLLWFGTDKGLARFDGSRFQVFDMNDGLPDPEVLGLRYDRRKRLWILCFQQKPCYRQDGRIVTAEQDRRIRLVNHDLWLEAYAAADSTVWFGTNGAAVHLDDRVNKYWYGERPYWFAEYDGRFFILAGTKIAEWLPSGQIKTVYNVPTPDSLRYSGGMVKPSETLHSVRTAGRYLLYGYTNRLLVLRYSSGTFRVVEERPVKGGQLYVDNRARVFVCGEGGGVVCFEQVNGHLQKPIEYFKNLKINKVFEDQQGTLWFCSFGEGVFAMPRHHPVVFGQEDGLPSMHINALAIENDSVLLAGDDRGTISAITGHITERRTYNPQVGFSRTRQILPLSDRHRWVAVDRDIFYDDGQTLQRLFTEGSIKSMVVRRDGLWYGSAIQLARIDPLTQKSKMVKRGRVTVMQEDYSRNLWIGGTDGLYSEKDGFQANWNQRYPQLRGRIADIERGIGNKLWIATPGKGLLHVTVFDGAIRAVETIEHRPGQPFKNIQSIFVEPGTDRVWLATNRGVFGVEPGRTIRHFNYNDGLAGDDVNTVLVKGDTLWAGTTLGLSRLLIRAPDETADFRTCITGLRYQTPSSGIFMNLLDSVPAGRWVELPPQASLVELELSGLEYRRRGDLYYECVITKLPPPPLWWTFTNLFTWVGAGFGPAIDTTLAENDLLRFGVQMAAGRYQIQVTAIKSNEQRSNQPAWFTLVKRPAWFQCLWVWLFFIGLAIIAGLLWMRTQLSNRTLHAAVSELQLQALRAQINPHFIGNSINAIQQFFFPPDPVTASEYIALFNRLLRDTMHLSEQHFINFHEELTYQRDYLEMIKLRFGPRFSFEIDGTDQIPANTPFPSMVLQPVIENATIHGLAADGKSQLHIAYGWQGEKLVCTVTDNGIGFRAAEAKKRLASIERKSKGLELLYRKIDTLNKLFHLQLTLVLRDRSDDQPPQKGTRVELAFFPGRVPTQRLIAKPEFDLTKQHGN